VDHKPNLTVIFAWFELEAAAASGAFRSLGATAIVFYVRIPWRSAGCAAS